MNDVSICLAFFEKQIARTNFVKEDWITYILSLLPLEIAYITAREPIPEANNYDYVKNLLLKRFKMIPEEIRQKFVSHKK